MLLIGLLLVALACLVVGLIMASGVWLVASLVASAVAGYVLWRERERVAARTGVHKDQAAPKTTSASKPRSLITGTAFTPNPDATAANGTANGAKSGATDGAADNEQSVWVVDGQPQFHAENCAAIQNLDAEAIPLAQALDDAFTECTVCKPVASASAREQVWVVDGRPDYHVEDCRSSKIASAQSGTEAQQIPRGQAVEDGFSPCPDCRPDGAAPADTPAPGAAAGAETPEPAGTVWVVDGRPRYHLADCLIIKDQDAAEIPLDQATEDGFMACSMCEPNVTRV